ncbi:peptidoglycan-binding protein [Saccharothrix sp. S26]|uniref:peptidoglycan-binding domain-containing protein n=1 Tax=Saccharothrix sp. S26 TaxID=2907215 RepID=UPI001F1AFDD0|nr:peptidoglycan-binding domain-containing protein [Saccharothrix sp. S26]MCE6998161.1 peptidoglycan-binding protein [Saccharothrix sp. S26]
MKPIDAELLRRLARGDSLDAVLASLRPAEQWDVLRRCAAVRSFDRELYEKVLVAGVDGAPPFDAVVTAPEVEPVPGTREAHRLRPSARSRYWNGWWPDGVDPRSVPDDLRALVGRLARHYRAAHKPVDLLEQLVLLDHRAAAELFVRLYAKADHRHDLALCQELIDVLSAADRVRLIGPELSALRHDRAAYLRTRGLWSTEYLQSATFLETAGTKATYQRLIRGRGPRLVMLHGPSGRGKTMELRWLVSRVLVPRRVPCALGDFDVLDPVNVARYPWLLLVEAAAQLDQQLAAAPFTEFLERYAWTGLLSRREVADPSRAAAASRRLRDERDRLGPGVTRDFVRTLNEATAGRPAVMVLDALDRVYSNRPREELDGLLRQLFRLHHDCPAVRFVLAGRHPLTGPVLPPAVDRRLAPFHDQDALRYLADLRRIARPDLRQAIVAKAGGEPVVLARLADLVQQRPDITAAAIREYRADLTALVLQVLRPIDDPGLRWLLRYGMVPRTLSLDFVRAVVQPLLRTAAAGRLDLDDPGVDAVPGGESASLFPAVADVDVERLWTRLTRFAGTTSWVVPVPGEPDSLRFAPAVAEPMRRLVRPHPVHDRLHADAVAFFEHKAETDPDRWDRWTREAVYHRFRLEGPTAVDYWRAALDRVELGEARRRAALAEEVLGSDYVDADGDPLPWDGRTPIVTRATVVEARYELAAALTQVARVDGVEAADQLWSRAEENFAAVVRDRAEPGVDVVPDWRLAYVRAALALKSGDAATAQAELEDALPDSVGTKDEVRLRVLLGDVLMLLGDRHAPDEYRRAAEAAVRVGSHRWEPPIRLRVVRAHRHFGRVDEAIRELVATRRGGPLDDEQQRRCGLLAVELGLAVDRVEWAAYHARRVAGHDGDWEGLAAGAKVESAARRPLHALDLAHRAVRAAHDSAGTALGRELAGIAEGMVGHYGNALHELEAARSRWHREGDRAAVARCHTHAAVLLMREVGNLTLAEHHLAEAAELTARGGDAWCRAELARVELLGLAARPHEALDAVTAVLHELRRRSHPPCLVARAAVEGLAIDLPDGFGWLLDELITQLAEITPESARVVVLEELRRVPEPHDQAGRDAWREVEPLVRRAADRPRAGDHARSDLTLAEVDRLVGDRAAAARKLADARPAGGSWFRLREWSRAADRLGHPARVDVEPFLAEFAGHPMLCAAFLVERAEALIARNGVDEADALLGRAAPLLDAAGERETQWHARLHRARGVVAERSSREHEPELVRAGATFAVLGDTRRAAVASRFTRGQISTTLKTTRGRVRLAVADRELHVLTSVPPDVDATARHDHALVDAILGAGRGRVGSEPLAERLREDWQATCAGLGSLLLPEPALRGLGATGPFDLRCDVEDRRLSPVPWELALRPDTRRLVVLDRAVATFYRAVSREVAYRDEIRFVQVGLNRVIDAGLAADGDLGPRTREALSRYQRARGLTPDADLGADLLDRVQRDLAEPAKPLVVLAQPSGSLQLNSARGHLNSGVDLERVYGSHGFDVESVENPTLDRLTGAVARSVHSGRAPAVVHLAGGLRESGGGVALTFLAGGWATEAFSATPTAEEIPVTALNRVLAAVPRDEFRPLVVLDVNRPWGSEDAISYLMLRNAFAGDLFALGRCAGVLGTGLAGDGGYELCDAMISAIAAGRSLGEVAAGLRAPARHATGLDRVLPSAGVALHTHLPWLRLVPTREDGRDHR